MPELHEHGNVWIYKAILDKNFIFDDNILAYKYKNLNYPNKNYKKIFDPATFMKRGDVINFGGSYRNENKMIFDGKELMKLYTKVDDYGSVPPDFVVGDANNEFDIGDFEELIEHNTVNWLSKDKMKAIVLTQKNGKVKGSVKIKNKKWGIIFNVYFESEFVGGWWGSRVYKCEIEEDNIVIKRIEKYSIHNKKYMIEPKNVEDNIKLKTLVTSTNPTHIILANSDWYIFTPVKEYKITDENSRNFPLIWKKVTPVYTSEALITDQKTYDFYMSQAKYVVHSNNPADNTVNPMDNIYIIEVTAYPITIQLLTKDPDTLLNQIKEYINTSIEKYDDISERIPFFHEDDNLLEVNL